MTATVIGRFAPSPTGPLHFGSVVAAVASYLEARSRAGRWLVRIDNLDPPREEPGACALILATLEALQLEWDGPVVYQSARAPAYAAALAQLAQIGVSFPCSCSRRDLGSGPYAGTCRTRALSPTGPLAMRVRVDDEAIVVDDAVQGRYRQCLARVCGDFVVRRADGQYAYHLAVVVDDAWQGVTEVTRGADLLDSTPRQIHLQRLLALPQPRYAHVPVVVDANGDKLSKQTHAPAVLPRNAAPCLFHALCFLGLPPPAAALGAPPSELLAWAMPRWCLSAVRPQARPYRYPA